MCHVFKFRPKKIGGINFHKKEQNFVKVQIFSIRLIKRDQTTLIKILKVNCNAKRIGKIINDFSIEREAIYESAVTD